MQFQNHLRYLLRKFTPFKKGLVTFNSRSFSPQIMIYRSVFSAASIRSGAQQLWKRTSWGKPAPQINQYGKVPPISSVDEERLLVNLSLGRKAVKAVIGEELLLKDKKKEIAAVLSNKELAAKEKAIAYQEYLAFCEFEEYRASHKGKREVLLKSPLEIYKTIEEKHRSQKTFFDSAEDSPLPSSKELVTFIGRSDEYILNSVAEHHSHIFFLVGQ